MDEVPGAKVEALPASTPALLRPPLTVATGLTLGFLRWKYGFGRDGEARMHALRATLEDLRVALAGRRHLLDVFSYADVAMAVVLQMVKPVADRWITLGPAIREVWTNDELARDFSDLVEWRDGLYAAHRARS